MSKNRNKLTTPIVVAHSRLSEIPAEVCKVMLAEILSDLMVAEWSPDTLEMISRTFSERGVSFEG